MPHPALYFHGFASAPSSSKARFFKELLEADGYAVDVPDLNVPSFRSLRVTAEIDEIAKHISRSPQGLVVLGSSLGGLALVHALSKLGDAGNVVAKVVLIAPALDLPERWEGRITPTQFESWRVTGSMDFHHHGYGRAESLDFGFVTDLQSYAGALPRLERPGLIVHGRRDEVVDCAVSREFVRRNPSVSLEEFDTDHQMLDSLDEVGEAVRRFLR